ncbi:stabilizer of axonemal microtubules 2-like [Gigantopelta aegis]|uniref:stabilizer of axonemal microtubules 2-like n=1 Tax=Gigantopelta aegis TaxID=1735272 RepID=UPI001B889E26|nr:stabilizer of axonemal microtubules 2-like [Gigantopelta aegis]
MMVTKGRSEYREAFREHPLPARVNCKPEYEVVREEGVIEGVTTSRKAFGLPMKAKKTAPCKPADGYWQPKGDHCMVTSYMAGYPGKTAERVKPVQTITKNGYKTKFVAEPVYKTDYVQLELPERFVREKETYTPSKHKFQGESTVRSDFPPRSSRPRESFKQTLSLTSVFMKSDGPFPNKTVYKDAFPFHEIPSIEKSTPHA